MVCEDEHILMLSVKGTDAATSATESIIVRLTATFHINRRLIKASCELATTLRLAAPAVITALLERPGVNLETSLMIVLIVIV